MSVPYVESQRSTQVSDVSQQSGNSDLLVNNLVYQQPKALSLAVNRTYKKQYFQRNTYNGDKGQNMICDWNTGTSYVNCANSYVTFKLKLLDDGSAIDASANFGSGSAMNIINEMRIRSRSGTELDRLQNANLWSKYDSLYTKPAGNLNTVASVQGFGETRSGLADDAQVSSTGFTKFTIPLYALSPFFRPMKKQLLPPQLASGLHFEIVLEDFRTAFFRKGTAPPTDSVITGYTIDKVEFNLDLVDMTDDVQRTINTESAGDGLEYAYERIYTAISQQSASNLFISQQVRKAVSQACFATSIIVNQADKLDISKDSLISIPFSQIESYQYRLGSLYFPNQKVEDAEDGVEAYTISQEVYDKFKHPYMEGSVTLKEFQTSLGIVSASFEKDTALNMSGLPVNNSRTLELNLDFTSLPSAVEVVSFLQYCSVARAYVDNIAVAV